MFGDDRPGIHFLFYPVDVLRFRSCSSTTKSNIPNWDLALWVHRWFPLYPDNPMHHLLKGKNKRRKSPEPPQPEIPAKTTDRPPELGSAPKGAHSLSYRDLDVDSLIRLWH